MACLKSNQFLIFMKSKIFIITTFFLQSLNAQEMIYNGKVEYVKEKQLTSGEYIAIGSNEFLTFFNSASYVSIQKSALDIDKKSEELVRSIPQKFSSDSLEIERQKGKIKQQLQAQLGSSTESKTFIDYSSNVSKRVRKIGNQYYCVSDSIGALIWQLQSDTMTLEGLLCQKARTMFATKFFNVWFAPSIPFSAGPLNMHGLPGLIVLATSDDGKIRYRMKSIEYPLKNEIKFTSCTSEKIIKQSEFMKLQAAAKEEMKQNMENYKNERINNKQ
jgi:GLPGLI family protein